MKTKIIIGLAAAAVLGYGLFLWQIRKTGQEQEKLRASKQARKELAVYMKILEKQLKESEAKEAKSDSSLRAALANVARSRAHENIYKERIKVDSLLLKEIKEQNVKNDSLSKYFTADDWDCYIATQAGEDCN